MKKEKSPLLSVKDLSVSFGNSTIPVLKNISFDVNTHEALAIVGPNGSGKSVLLKTLLGAIPRSAGIIAWKENINIGYLPQRFQVDHYLPMTVKEFLSLKQLPRYSLQEIAELVKAKTDWLGKNLAHLSGGELQKTLLAWAIFDKPDILLFDEPTENVDVANQESIYALLYQLQDTLGVALVIVSHDIGIVYRYADNVLCLNHDMLCYGNPKETLTAKTLTDLYGTHTLIHDHQSHKNYDIH